MHFKLWLEDENRDFLANLQSNPQDHVSWSVYADWLEEHGDKRSDLIRLQLQLATHPSDQEEQKSFALWNNAFGKDDPLERALLEGFFHGGFRASNDRVVLIFSERGWKVNRSGGGLRQVSRLRIDDAPDEVALTRNVGLTYYGAGVHSYLPISISAGQTIYHYDNRSIQDYARMMRNEFPNYPCRKFNFFPEDRRWILFQAMRR